MISSLFIFYSASSVLPSFHWLCICIDLGNNDGLSRNKKKTRLEKMSCSSRSVFGFVDIPTVIYFHTLSTRSA